MTPAELERSPLERLAETWAAAWSSGERERFEACCTPDVSYEDPIAIEPLTGLEALAGHCGRLRAAFPDARVETTAPAIASGSHACLPWRMLGTHGGEIGAIPATNRFATVQGVHYAELSDGRIRRARGFFDLYDAATQLGLLPARGGFGEMALMLVRGLGLRRGAGS